jgi:hypothetical protein
MVVDDPAQFPAVDGSAFCAGEGGEQKELRPRHTADFWSQ